MIGLVKNVDICIDLGTPGISLTFFHIVLKKTMSRWQKPLPFIIGFVSKVCVLKLLCISCHN